MDGEHGLDIRKERQVGILNFQQCGHHAGLPVMRMNHVGLEVQQRQGVQRRAAEETKAFVPHPWLHYGADPRRCGKEC